MNILDDILARLDDIQKKVAVLTEMKIVFYKYDQNGQLTKAEPMDQLKVTQFETFPLAIKDKFGNPALVDGVPAWSVDDNALALIDPAADGMSAVLKPIGPVGIVTISVSADADMGAGVEAVSGSLPIELVAGQAVTIQLTAGPKQDV